MIPSTWAGVVMALGVYRIVRLIGWDDLPPILRARAWLVGAQVQMQGSSNAVAGLTGETPQMVWTYKRPVLAHFLQCAFCQGFWTSIVCYVAWATLGHWALYALVPLAISAAVGLIAKNLDP